MKLSQHTFIITGGASGLGLATVSMIIAHQGNAVILDINEEKGLSAEQQFGSNCLFIKTDISNEAEVIKAIAIVKETFGHISGLINCAGMGPAKRVVGKEGPHPLAFFEKAIQVNLVGTFNTIRLVANEMQHNAENEGGERGVIINTASVAAFDGQIGQAAYSASKGGIVSMTLPIAREFARMGIRVMCIAPGIFETPLLSGLPEEAQESLGKQVPFPNRLGKPSEFAELVKHILTNEMLNGEVIRLDGAMRMGAK